MTMRDHEEVYGLYDIHTQSLLRFATPESLAFAIKNTPQNILATCFAGKRSGGSKGMIHADEWLKLNNQQREPKK